MTLDALLKLEKTESSIEAVEAFLTTELSEHDRLTAESFYADILFELASYEASMHFYMHIMANLKHKMDDPRYEHALDQMIKIYIALASYDEAEALIEKRKNTLPILKRYQYYLDLIELKKAKNEDYQTVMDQALEEVLPENVKSIFMFEKLNQYINNHEQDLALKTIYQLKMKKLDPKTLQQLELMEMDILIEQKDYQALESRLLGKTDVVYDYYHLSALIGLDKLRQASVFEVEHEYRFNDLDTDTLSKLYPLIISLYEQLSDKVSLDTYQKRFKALKKVSKPIKVVTEKVEIEKAPVAYPKIEIKEKIVEVNKVKQSIEFEKIANLLKISLGLSNQLNLREKLRVLLIEAEKLSQFQSVVIYTTPHTIYHYKKERLYDKPFTKEHFLKSALHVAFDRQESIIEDTDLIRWDTDILTGNPYQASDIKKVYIYPSSLGVITYYQTHTLEPMFYDDFFRLLSILLFSILTKDDEKASLDHSKKLYQSIYQSDLMAYRIVESDLMRFNKAALALFDYPKHTPLNQFIADLAGDDQIKYKQFIQKLDQKQTIQYHYHNRLIEETALPFKLDNQTIILSAFKDMTDQAKSEETLLSMATKDMRYGLKNQFAFEQDVIEYFNDKTTFCLIELKDLSHLKSLYGMPVVDAYFEAFTQFSSAYFDEIYLFDVNKIMGIIKANDIRAIEKAIKTYETALMDSSTPMPNQHYQVNMGVIRFPINTTETKLDKFYGYLSLALEKASRKKHKNIHAYFDFQDYKEEQFEVSLIEQMDQAITSETLHIQFSPIIHLSTNKVFSYLVSPYLPLLSVDSAYYALIAQKRMMTTRFDKYMLKAAFKYLSQLEKQTSKYVRLTIEIDEETIKLKDINAYIIGLFKQYDLPYSICSIMIKSKDLQDVDFLKLKELFDLGIHISVESFEYMVKDVHFIHIKDKYNFDQLKVMDYLLMQKDYATNHGIGLVFEQLDEEHIKKLKTYQAIYHLDRKKTMDEQKLTQMVGGVKS